jgi:hypothetical protein
LPGAGEAPVAQVATDRRGRQAADLGGLGDGQGLRLLGVITAPVLRGRLLVAHIRSLSRPACGGVPAVQGPAVAWPLHAVTGRAPPSFLGRPGAWSCEPPRGREGNWQGCRRRWPPSVAYARLSPRWTALTHVAEPSRFCRRSAQPVRTSPSGRGSPRTMIGPPSLLSRADATHANDPGWTRMRPTRLKTARSAVRSRPCPPRSPSSAASLLGLPR